MSKTYSWLDPPEEKTPYCECGHSYEDHSTSGLADWVPLLEALREIDAIVCKTDFSLLGEAKYKSKLRSILDIALAVCAECDCHKFKEEEPDRILLKRGRPEE